MGDKKRRLIQLYCAVLYNANIKGFVKGEIFSSRSPATKALCVPGLNCYSCPGATGACPLGALQNAVGSADKSALFYVVGILMLYGLILGRTICGFLCPFGLIQELLHKIPTVKIKKGRFTRILSYLKYVILALFVFIITAYYAISKGLPVPAFCKYICPAGTFEGAVMLLSNQENAGFFSMLGAVFTNKIVIMLSLALLCIFCYRAFCRFLCPLGAIYGFFNKIALIGVKVDAGRCNGCGKCVRTCEMDVLHVGDHECIHCCKCIDVCDRSAISFKAGKYTLVSPSGESHQKKKGLEKLFWAIALSLLCLALVYFNFFGTEPDNKASVSVSDVTYGYEVGCYLPDFSITCMDGSVFTLSENLGKPVFINLWATYCGPCVKELPYFSNLNKEHEGDIAVLALHSDIIVDDPKAYLAKYGSTWDMTFAIDSEQSGVWALVGGSTVMPQTIVLNRRGEVVFNQVGSVTEQMLKALYDSVKDENNE